MSAEKEIAPLSHETQRSLVKDGFRMGLAVRAGRVVSRPHVRSLSELRRAGMPPW